MKKESSCDSRYVGVDSRHAIPRANSEGKTPLLRHYPAHTGGIYNLGVIARTIFGGYYRGACNEGERRLGIPDADIDHHFPQKTKTQARNGMRRSACPDDNLSTDIPIKKYLKRADIKARKNSNND